MRMPIAPQKIVILGGGYVGLYVAWTLEKYSELPLEVTLIEPRAYMTYQPLLPEVAGGHVDPRNVTVDLRQALTRTNVVRGSVTGLDSKAKTVTVAPIDGGETVYDYDHVVVGLGAVTRTFPTPGLAEHGVGFKTVEEAAHTRNTVLLNVAKAAATTDPAERRKYLTFVFIGGGYTGVEALSELSDLSKRAIAAQPALAGEEPHWILIEALDRVAPEVGPELSKWTLGELEHRGIDIRLKTTMKSCEDAVAVFSDGDEVPFGLLVWTAGVKPHPVLASTDLPLGPRGHVNTSPKLQVIREDGGWVRGVWAAGDCAQIPDLTKPQPAWYPPNAQNALRQAVRLADNIARTVRRKRPRNYVHYSLGTVASYGLFHGAANVFGVQLKEVPAWLVHRGYHLLAMPTTDRKVRIFAGWVADFVGKPDLTPTDDLEDPTHDFRVAAGGK
jgi:NADH:ubiquinone reductase (H+-translocating)